MSVTEQRLLTSSKLITPKIGVLQWRMGRNDTIEGFDIYLNEALSSFKYANFQVCLDGVPLFDDLDLLTVDPENNHATKSGLSIDVEKGQIIRLDYYGNAHVNIGTFLTFMIQFADLSNIEFLGYACSDESTDLTTGVKITDRVAYAFTGTEVRASLTTASSSGAVEVDILKNGVSILSTPLTIDASEKTSITAAVPAVISGGQVNYADDNELSIEVVDEGTGAKGLKVRIIGHK